MWQYTILLWLWGVLTLGLGSSNGVEFTISMNFPYADPGMLRCALLFHYVPLYLLKKNSKVILDM
jgi:hypothetical protein